MMKFLGLPLLFSFFMLNSCTQPDDHKTISFYLSDEMDAGYSLIELNEPVPELPAMQVQNRHTQISFLALDLSNTAPKTLVLYKGEDKMLIHIIDFENGERGGHKMNVIPFIKGQFVLNFNMIAPAIPEKINWRNYQIHPLDSLYYYQNIRDENSSELSLVSLFTKDIKPVKYTFFEEGRVSKQIDMLGNSMVLRYYFKKHTDFPKLYVSRYEKIEIDSLGFIVDREIYDRDCNSISIAKIYKHNHQIGKHYRSVQSSLPLGVFQNASAPYIANDDYLNSPLINRETYSISVKNMGYFPQDSIETYKFKATSDSVYLRVSFYSGADEIGDPIVLKDTTQKDITYQIYLSETVASSDFEWERELYIPLYIDPFKRYEIYFPYKGTVSLLPSKEYEFAPRWILSGSNPPVYEAITIYGCKWELEDSSY